MKKSIRSFNLLPEEYKKQLISLTIYRTLQTTLIGVIVLLLLGYSILWASQWIISVHNEGLQQITTLQEQSDQNNKLNAIIQTLNEKIFFLSHSGLNATGSNTFIGVIIENMPPSNIGLTNIDLDIIEKKIHMQGNALTRDDLLTFQSQLEASENFYNVTFPLENLTKAKNLEEKMTFIDNLFLTQQRTLEYIQTIEKLAQEQSLTLEITLSEPTTEERFTYSTINFNVKGSWAHVYTFIHNIENTGTITVLTTINIQPTGTLTSADPQDTTAVIATLTGQVPFMQE